MRALGLDPVEIFTPQASCDDAFEKGNGDYNYDDGDIVIQPYTDTGSQMYQCAGIRFPNIPIPSPVVTTAKFRAYTINTANDEAHFKIYGDTGFGIWVANPRDFCDNAFVINPFYRPRTTAYVSVEQVGLGVGWYEITGLEDILNELFALPEWVSGNPIVLLFIADVEDFAEGWMPYSYDGVSAYRPQLEIKWKLPVYNPLINKPLVSPIIAGKPIVRCLKKRGKVGINPLFNVRAIQQASL